MGEKRSRRHTSTTTMKVAATILALALSTLGHYAYAGDYIQVDKVGGCDKNMDLRDMDECASAAASLGYTFKSKIVKPVTFWPFGCIKTSTTTLWFNTINGTPRRGGYNSGKSICKKAPDCGCGEVTAAQDGCQCGTEWNARCKTGQRCVDGQTSNKAQCKTISSCKELKRIPMSPDRKAECINECRKTWCSGGCQSYNLYQGYCILSSCPYKGEDDNNN